MKYRHSRDASDCWGGQGYATDLVLGEAALPLELGYSYATSDFMKRQVNTMNLNELKQLESIMNYHAIKFKSSAPDWVIKRRNTLRGQLESQAFTKYLQQNR